MQQERKIYCFDGNTVLSGSLPIFLYKFKRALLSSSKIFCGAFATGSANARVPTITLSPSATLYRPGLINTSPTTTVYLLIPVHYVAVLFHHLFAIATTVPGFMKCHEKEIF